MRVVARSTILCSLHFHSHLARHRRQPMTYRTVAVLVAGAVAGVSSMVGLAGAHECFNASRADRANTVIAQHSHGWFDIQTSQVLAIRIVSSTQTRGSDSPPSPPLSAADMTALDSGNFDALVAQILGFAPAE